MEQVRIDKRCLRQPHACASPRVQLTGVVAIIAAITALQASYPAE